MQIRFPRGWCGWKNLSSAVEAGTPPDAPGAYAIRDPNRDSIPRFLDEDDLAILDIGESSNLNKRIRAFLRSAANDNAEGHMAGWRFRNLRLHNQIQVKTLEVRWRTRESKAAAYSEESELMHRYVEAFGELPPLNYKYNWQKRRNDASELEYE